MQEIEEALRILRVGGMIIVTDSETRENEGDLVALAETITPEQVTFMAIEGRGLICTPISEEMATRLALAPMTEDNTDNHGTAFTISIDHIDTTTGISAYDRALTIQALTSEQTVAQDFRRPGHVFPLIAKAGGVLERDGHTEAGVDLAKLCDKKEVAVICEIMGDDGHMLTGEKLTAFAKKHVLPIISIEALKQYIEQTKGAYSK